MASELQQEIVQYVADHNEMLTHEFAAAHGHDHQKVVGAVKSLELAHEGNLATSIVENQSFVVLPEGELVAQEGSPEVLLFASVPPEGIAQHTLMKVGDYALKGFKHMMVNKWVRLDKSKMVIPLVKTVEDHVRHILSELLQDPNFQLSPADAKMLQQRKLVKPLTTKAFLVTKGPHFSTRIEKLETDLTPEMIATGTWKGKRFKKYNFAGVQPSGGHLHPLLKVRAQYRAKFLEMGFTEMPTNNFVESSFWNFDALFQPQQHPARDSHDTFFLSDPAKCLTLPEEYKKIVKHTHETGGNFGSIGYRYDWSEDEARKNILRTHTTAVSARMLKRLAEQETFTPAKYFSIDRVFRNETMDATHLAEFHQIEGLVADYNLTLGDLIGTINQFFAKLGMTNIRFKPAYNPYTEPSMEIFSYHEGLKKWVEVGNSGMFRPEMLRPMGLPEDVVVIAWGLSLERPTMIMYGIDNIRDLVGHKVNLDMVMNNPICTV